MSKKGNSGTFSEEKCPKQTIEKINAMLRKSKHNKQLNR